MKSDFQNSSPRLYFQSRGIFVIFHIFGAFSQKGISYLIFVFWMLCCHQIVKTISHLIRNHVLILNYAQKFLKYVPQIWKNSFLNTLCMNIYDFTIQSICRVTNPSPLNLISSSKSLIVTFPKVQYLNFTIEYSQIIMDDWLGLHLRVPMLPLL